MDHNQENHHAESGYVPEITLEDAEPGTIMEEQDLPEDNPPCQEGPLALDEPATEPQEVPKQAAKEPVPDASENAPIEMFFSPLPAETAVMEKPESRWKKLWREKKVFVILSALFFLLALGAVIAISYVYLVIKPYGHYDKIMPNVYCAGVNLGGMTREEAQEAIEEALRHPDYSVTVTLPDASYEFHPEQEGVTLNGASVAQRAYDYSRSDPSAYGMYKAYKAAKKTEYQLDAETELVYSKEDIQKQAVEVYSETEVKPTESTVQFDSETHTVSLTLGTPGRKIEPQTIVDAVDFAFASLNFSDIALKYEKVEIDMEALKELTEVTAGQSNSDPVEPEVYADQDAHTIDVTMGQPGYKMRSTDLYALAKEAVESEAYGTVTLELEEVLPTDVDITEAYQTLACDPKEPYYYGGTLYESENGYTLDWEAAISEIMATGWGEKVSVPMTAVAPKRTKAEMEPLLFRDKLSTYSSPHTSNANRTNNLKLACQAIDGTVLNAGETFSFNGVVGERTAAKGYKEATVYVGTESKGELGGGICQVASTIYDAVLYADLEVTVRAPHIFYVTYVPGGLDATVYWGSQDFCFRNNTEYPVWVSASVSGGYVNITLWGTKENSNYVKLDYSRLSSTPYSTVKEYSSSLPAGTSKETVSPYTGYVYEAYQYVYDGDGNLLETNYLGKSTYKKRDQVITVGTG